MDKESPEERLSKVPIKPVEKECLERVFEFLSKTSFSPNVAETRCTEKPEDFKEKISANDLIKTLQTLGEKPTKSEVDLMIWVLHIDELKC